MLYTKGINPSVKTFRSLTDGIDHRWKKFDFWPILLIHRLTIFFLMTTIDLIDVFCCQSIIGIDPINVFFYHRCPTMVSSILIGWVAGQQRLLLAYSWERERPENPGTPRTIEASWGWIWQVISTLPRQNCHVTHTPTSQLCNCADPGQTTSNVYVSHILILAWKIVSNKKFGSLNLDVVSWSPRSNIT